MADRNSAASPAMLSLGGNVGDVVAAFAGALAAIEASQDCHVVKCSSVWRTKPWGKTDQPDFLNMAAAIETRLAPQDLLALCLSLEREAGRERWERWGPRTLDIDIIDYADVTMLSEDLTLPHPRAHERAFVLAPVSEIDPKLILSGKPVDVLLNSLAASDGAGGCTVDRDATARLQALFPVVGG